MLSTLLGDYDKRRNGAQPYRLGMDATVLVDNIRFAGRNGAQPYRLGMDLTR